MYIWIGEMPVCMAGWNLFVANRAVSGRLNDSFMVCDNALKDTRKKMSLGLRTFRSMDAMLNTRQ